MENRKLVKTTFNPEDCIYLLTDIDGKSGEISMKQKMENMKKGRIFSDVISEEIIPAQEVVEIFKNNLEKNANKIAKYVAIVSEKLLADKGKNLVICSLARIGTPIGVMIKRYIMEKHQIDIPHYGISVIRKIGMDFNAIDYILKTHPNADIAFVDGWTGLGGISGEVKCSVDKYNKKNGTSLDNGLVVLSDPAKIAKISGTQEDFCIPHACMTATVNGLVSHTVYNPKFINETDFHGAKCFTELLNLDLSYYFIDRVCQEFSSIFPNLLALPITNPVLGYVDSVIDWIHKNVDDTQDKKIRITIGEVTRSLLKLQKSKIYVRKMDDSDIDFVKYKAQELGNEIIEIENMPTNYNCFAVLEEYYG